MAVDIEDDFVVLDRDDASDSDGTETPVPLERITAWLSPTSYDAHGSEYQKHLSSHTSGTGGWLTSTPAFRQWHDSETDGLLWIKGIPGSGKSVFAAHLASRLGEENVPVLFFFFRQIIDANHSPLSLLRDWLAQILPSSPPLQSKLGRYVKADRDLESLSIDELWKDLHLAISRHKRVYVVADALDEMDRGNDEFLRSLGELGSWRPANVKVILTSRPIPAIEAPLRNIPFLGIRLEEQMVDVDIATYVQHRLRASTVSNDDSAAICRVVPGRANGLFLYARLAMDAFMEPDADIQAVLRRLPADLNVMYTDLLREHARRSGIPEEMQLQVMRWVTHASRPLRLLELAEMVDVTFNDPENRDLKASKSLVRAACGPLIEILPDETISVVHHSLTEFLKGQSRVGAFETQQNGTYPVLHPGTTHSCLAIACLSYLQSGCLDGTEPKPVFIPGMMRPNGLIAQDLKMKFPFLEYASANWHVHATKASTGGLPENELNKLHNQLDLFLQPGTMDEWVEIYWPTTDRLKNSLSKVTPLHVSAYTGVAEYVRLLANRPAVEINGIDHEGNTALHYAAGGGHMAVVKVLIEMKAGLDESNEIGLKPLHMAASNNRAEVVTLLLTAGVKPMTPKTKESPGMRCGNSQPTVGHTPLLYSCQNGHTESVAAFLPFLDLESVQKALSWAASRGHSKIVELLLQYPGVEPDYLISGDSALFLACLWPDHRTIELLLQAGSNPNLACQNYRPGRMRGVKFVSLEEPDTRSTTPMHALANSKLQRSSQVDNNSIRKIFELLRKAGGDVGAADTAGMTPLMFASSDIVINEDPILVRLLLEAGADATHVSDRGDTALHLSSQSRSGATVRLLVELGKADINAKRTVDGRTPLMCFVENLATEATRQLLKYGPDCGITDLRGDGPLHIALTGHRYDHGIVTDLLAAGADRGLKNHKGETALHKCGEYSLEALSLLVNDPMDLEAKDNEGKTVIFRADGKVLQTFLDLGARIDARDYSGRTLLHYAVRKFNDLFDKSLFYNLLEKGADAKAVDNHGNSLLHELAASFHACDTSSNPEHVFQAYLDKLVRLGVHPDQPNHRGRTPLHQICSVAYDSISQTRMGIDIFLKICKVEVADNNGVTPLHLASNVSECIVRRLLDAGANASAQTLDGLSALHLAARAQQSNIVGMLLSHFSEKYKHGAQTIIDTVDSSGRTALFYACRSGRPETVSLLLEAGADPNRANGSAATLLSACEKFEEEQKLWAHFGGRKCGGACLHAGEMGIEDQKRPWVDPPLQCRTKQIFDSEQHGARLEEILDMLVVHNTNISKQMNWGWSTLTRAVFDTASQGNDYTSICLLNLYDSMREKSEKRMHENFEILCSKYRRDAVTKAYKERSGDESKRVHGTMFKGLLYLREYDMLRTLGKSTDLLDIEMDRVTPFHLLVQYGFAQLLKAIGSKAASNKIEDYRNVESSDPHRPLLVTACERELPNMEVIKVLVEEHQVDVNTKCFKRIFRKEYKMAYCEDALHVLARGKHFWHVSQALPYLLKAGASINARDEDDRTPLHVALDPSNDGTWCKEAARVLIEHGADVNALDSNNRSCLSMINGDEELAKLLLQHGACCTVSTILRAIDSGDNTLLRILLSSGVDPNQLVTPANEIKDKLSLYQNPKDPILATPQWLIHYAATPMNKYGRAAFSYVCPTETQDSALGAIRLLLQYGADPFAQFSDQLHAADDSEESAAVITKTVLHEILREDGFVKPFLELDSLEVNRRDSNGRTLLLAACEGRFGPCVSINGAGQKSVSNNEVETSSAVPEISVGQRLIELGADLAAKTKEGNNILHLILQKRVEDKEMELIGVILDREPQLVKERNKVGQSPFHIALQSSDHRVIERLLTGGADPFMPDSEGNCILHHFARMLGSERQDAEHLFAKYIALGVPIDTRNCQGETPLFSLVRSCVPSRCKVLFFQRDVPLDEQVWPHEEKVRQLVDAGADVFARSNAGEGLLHLIAAIPCHPNSYQAASVSKEILDFYKLFLAMGLDPMAEDNLQRTSLDNASACGHESILKLFDKNST